MAGEERTERTERTGSAPADRRCARGCAVNKPFVFAEVIDVPCDAKKEREILDLLAKAHQASREGDAE